MTTREVGNRTVWCATCAGGAWSYADVIRESGLALGDALDVVRAQIAARRPLGKQGRLI